MKPCWWLARRWHRRQRNIDRQFIVPAIRKRVGHSFLGSFDEAWAVFVVLDGQEHWRCACGAGKTSDAE